MIWILHILAAVFFFPALFVTIPAHLILNRIPAKVSTEEATPGTSGAETAITLGLLVVLVLIMQACGL